MFNSARRLTFDHKWSLHQGSSSKYTFISIQNWLQKHKVNFLQWSSWYPSQKSIENLCSEFKTDVYMHNAQNINDLEMHGKLVQDPSTCFPSLNIHDRKNLNAIIFYSLLPFTYYCEALCAGVV